MVHRLRAQNVGVAAYRLMRAVTRGSSAGLVGLVGPPLPVLRPKGHKARRQGAQKAQNGGGRDVVYGLCATPPTPRRAEGGCHVNISGSPIGICPTGYLFYVDVPVTTRCPKSQIALGDFSISICGTLQLAPRQCISYDSIYVRSLDDPRGSCHLLYAQRMNISLLV